MPLTFNFPILQTTDFLLQIKSRPILSGGADTHLSPEVHRSFFLQKSTDLSFSRSPQIFLSPEVHRSFFLQKSTDLSFSRSPQIFLSPEVHRSFFLQKSTDLSFSRSPLVFLSPEVHRSFFLQKSTDLSFSRSPQIFVSPEVHWSFFLQKSTDLSFSRSPLIFLSPEFHRSFSRSPHIFLFNHVSVGHVEFFSLWCVLLCRKHASVILHVLLSPVCSLMYNAVFRLRIRVKENLQQCHTMFCLSFGRMLGRSVYLFNMNVTETSMRVCWHVQLSFTCHCISKQQNVLHTKGVCIPIQYTF